MDASVGSENLAQGRPPYQAREGRESAPEKNSQRAAPVPERLGSEALIDPSARQRGQHEGEGEREREDSHVPSLARLPRPVCHHQRDSIEAHPTIVFAALAVSRWIERQASWISGPV